MVNLCTKQCDQDDIDLRCELTLCWHHVPVGIYHNSVVVSYELFTSHKKEWSEVRSVELIDAFL